MNPIHLLGIPWLGMVGFTQSWHCWRFVAAMNAGPTVASFAFAEYVFESP